MIKVSVWKVIFQQNATSNVSLIHLIFQWIQYMRSLKFIKLWLYWVGSSVQWMQSSGVLLYYDIKTLTTCSILLCFFSNSSSFITFDFHHFHTFFLTILPSTALFCTHQFCIKVYPEEGLVIFSNQYELQLTP